MSRIAYGSAVLAIAASCAFACLSSSQSEDASDAGADGPGDAPLDVKPPLTGDDDADSNALTYPAKLSETGLYADIATRKFSDGLIAFAPRWSFWVDGAQKDRHLYLPPGTKIDTTNMDGWKFPIGTKVWKEFKVDGKVIETRMLWKQRDGGLGGVPDVDGWTAVAYVWRADGSDADATPNGIVNAAGTTHDVPATKDCTECHTDAADVIIGVSALQLSSDDGATGMIRTLPLTSPPANEFQVPGTGVVKDALTYLHANCGHCHSGRGRLATQTAMRLVVRTTDTTPESTLIYQTYGTKTRHIDTGTDTVVVPGQPDQSQMWVLMSTRRLGSMPPLSTKVVDPAESVVRDWILGLPP
jgi:hypothetical protein